jgi:pyridoxal phosphate enzyme (YggS family)
MVRAVDVPTTTIAGRLAEVRGRIAAAAQRAGRSAESVTLLAVSKTKPEAQIREAYAAGQRDFGENYVQELSAKAAALADLPGLRWHLIGPLQRNKVKPVVPVAALVHTVDRPALAQEIEKRAAAAGRVVPVLLEVNVSGEASKAGCPPAEAGALAGAVRAMPHLALRGLMTIPPDTGDREQARPFFAALRALRDRLGDLPELSMGMSHDFEIAVEEGATIVRVGTAIFGSRP